MIYFIEPSEPHQVSTYVLDCLGYYNKDYSTYKQCQFVSYNVGG